VWLYRIFTERRDLLTLLQSVCVPETPPSSAEKKRVYNARHNLDARLLSLGRRWGVLIAQAGSSSQAIVVRQRPCIIRPLILAEVTVFNWRYYKIYSDQEIPKGRPRVHPGLYEPVNE
jgi:hypothetical protein